MKGGTKATIKFQGVRFFLTDVVTPAVICVMKPPFTSRATPYEDLQNNTRKRYDACLV